MMFLLIFFNIIFIVNRCMLADTQAAINDDRVNDPFQGLMTLSPVLDKETNHTFMILNDPANYERVINQLTEYFLSSDKDKSIVPNSIERLRAIPRSERLFNVDLIKRSAVHGNSDRKKNIPRKKQKKVKLLGRLLVNNNKDEVTRGDYDEENDEDNSDKMNRGNIQDEDDPNIMELIVFNRRRKTKTNRNRKV